MEIVSSIVNELETLLKQQKDFKKREDVKLVFEENREFNKQVKEVKNRLKDAMRDAGETSVVVGNTEVEIKDDVRSKHDMTLLQESMDPEKYTEYLSCVQVADNKVLTRKAGSKKRKVGQADE